MMQAEPESSANPTSMPSIRLFVMDVDGTLTDGRIRIGNDGCDEKVFHAHDGAGIALLRCIGIEPAIASGRTSKAATRRARELGIERVAQGVRDKAGLLSRWCEDLKITTRQAAFMGDDLGDAAAMLRAGYGAAPAGAVMQAKQAATFVCSRNGGDGAVREAIEDLITRLNGWPDVLQHYGLPATHVTPSHEAVQA